MATTKNRASPKLSVGRGEKLPVSKGAGLTAKGRAKYNKATAVGSLLSWLPHLASLFTIVWLGIRIWETATVQKIVEKRRVAKTKKAINDARRK
jgi:hypothetical protein